MVRLLSLALSLALLGAFPLPASAGDESPNRFFEVYDKDHDGRVTPDELGADGDVFRLLDKNGDGTITPEDLGTTARPPKGPRDAEAGGRGPDAKGRGGRGQKGPGARGGGMQERLRRMDANEDGKVTREEFKGPAELFDRLDMNEDGVLDGPELEATPRGGQGRGGQGRGGQGRGGQGRGGQGRNRQGPPSMERWKKHLEAMDVDGDGKITKDEYQGRLPFERLDANGDGYLDAKDLEAALKRRGGAGARPDRPTPEQMREALKKMDANGDGRITKDEYTGPIPFERLDRDGDGALTEKDMARRGRGAPDRGERGGGRDRAERLRRHDRDGDGKISREEFPGPDEMFDRLDRNGDGFLTAEDHSGGASGREHGTTTKPATRGVSLEALDKDGNGKLSRNEFPGTDDAWRTLDANRDGWVTADECAAR